MQNRGLPPDTASSRRKFWNRIPASVKISGAYLVVGLLWIFFSDRLLSRVLHYESDILTYLQTFKGSLYVLVTAAMLGWLVTLETRANQRTTNRLKKVLEELWQSEERFRVMVEEAFEAVSIIDTSGQIIYASPNSGRFLGNDPDNAVGIDWSRDLHPDDVEPAIATWQSLFERPHEPIRTMSRMRHRNGSWRWIEGTARNLLDHPAIGGILVNWRDITDRHLAEEALRASEERFRVFMDNSPASAWITDPEGRMDYASATYTRMFRVPSDLIGQSVCDIYPADIAQICVDNIQMVARQRHALETVEPGLRADGSIGEFLVYKFPLPQPDGQIAVGGVAVDVTEWRQAEASLYQREQEFRALVENAPDIIVRFDRALRHLYVNPAIEPITGRSPQSFLGKTNRELGMPEDQVALWDAAFSRVFMTGQPSYLEFDFPTPEGLRDFQARCVPEWTSDGAIASALVIARDITEQKRLERALRDRLAQEQALNRVIQVIRQSLNLTSIFRTATIEMAELLQTNCSAVLQYQPQRQRWKPIATYHLLPNSTLALNTDIPDEGNAIATQLKQFNSVRISNPHLLRDDAIQDLVQHLPGPWLFVPLVVDQALWGSFSLFGNPSNTPWTEEQANLVQTVADQLAIAIQQAQAFTRAQTELAERQQAEAHLRAALAEKDVLLKEIHHRVKNNLQIVSGLLQLQAERLSDQASINALRESQNRIESMSLIHKKLYTSSDLGHIDVADYIQSLALSLQTTYPVAPGTITLAVEVEPVILSLDQAIPCGLIINELVSNALKYAFPNNRRGEINVKLCKAHHQIELTIQDNGVGLPPDLDWQTTQSLGLSLVQALATDQLDGTFGVEPANGTTFKITFPKLLSIL